MDNLLNDPTATKLHRDLCQLRERGATEGAINEARRKFNIYLHELKTRALARWKEEWLEDRYEKIIQTRGRISHDRSSAIDRAQALFRVMPERARLADMMKSNEHRTRAQRLSAVQDLVSLCRRNFEVFYRPGEEPVDGACPVCQCKLSGVVKRKRSDHIHACRRKEFVKRVKGGPSPVSYPVLVKYCFLCFEWVNGAAAWEEHCQGHLASTMPKWCAPRVYCRTLISPGFCPWCLRKADLPAAERLRQWSENYILMAHVEAHIENVDSWPNACPCGKGVEDANSLRHHLSDEYGLWKAEWKMFGRKRASEGDQNTDDPEHTLDAEDAGQMSPRKTRKRTNTGHKFIVLSSSCKGQSLNPPTSRAKASNGRDGSPKVDPNETTFIEWSPAAKASSSYQPSSQGGGPCTGGPAISTQLSPNHYPEPNWDSRSVTAVDESDGAPDDQALLELSPESHNQLSTEAISLASNPQGPMDRMNTESVGLQSNSGQILGQDLPIPCLVAGLDSTLAPDCTADWDCADQIQRREWQSDSPPPFDGSPTDTYLGSDAIFSDYLRSRSPSCSPIQEAQDCNAEPAVDVPDGGSTLTSNTAPLLTEFVNVDNDPDRLDEGCQVKPDRRRVRLRINAPKAKIILRLTRPKHVARATQRA
jgi:hypothetical protein